MVGETADTVFLVLPFGTSQAARGGEIPDRDLESVAGGGTEGGIVFDPSPGLGGGPVSCVSGPCVYD